MNYQIFYLITLLFISTSSFINLLFFQQLGKARFGKILSSYLIYLVGTGIVSGVFVYFYFFPEGEYLNRGLGIAVLTTVFDVLIGNAVMFFLIQKRFKKNNRHPFLFFLLLPMVALLYIVLLVIGASMFDW